MNNDLRSKLIQAGIIIILISIILGLITIVRYFWPYILIIFLLLLIPKDLIQMARVKFDELYKKYFFKQKSQYSPENDKKNIVDAEIIED